MNTKKEQFVIRLKAEKVNPKTQGLAATLGQKKIKPMDFCNEFNSALGQYGDDYFRKEGCLVSVLISKTEDGKFKIVSISPCVTSEFLQSKLGVEGFGPLKVKGKMVKQSFSITRDDLLELANIKLRNANSRDLEKVYKSLLGTMKSFNIAVKE